MWDNNNLLINKKRPSSHIEKLQVDNKRYEQPLTISNCLNDFFCNVPSTLAAQLPKSHKSATSYLSQKRIQFCFAQVSEIEVFLLLESLDTNKSFGIDKIHPLLLKTAALQIYRPLTLIFNLSINKGIFPDSMKLAKVVPIFKQGSRFVCSNYRPISVLSSISKILERCIFNQLMFYFTNNNMISPKQYGFRPGFTTSDFLIDLIEEITSSLDKGLYVVSLFLDLSKAFDTVNHQILLNKLKYYGLQQSEYNWFQSYLNNRKQQVHANGVASDTRFISTGVPQGSILGLCCLLFSLMTFQSLPPFFLPDYMQTIHL